MRKLSNQDIEKYLKMFRKDQLISSYIGYTHLFRWSPEKQNGEGPARLVKDQAEEKESDKEES